MRTNFKLSYPAPKTHEGAPAVSRLMPLQQLQRAVSACLLWEDQFYEDGQSIGDRIQSLVHQVPLPYAAQAAINARNQQHLRHVPLLIAKAMCSHPQKNIPSLAGLIAATLAEVIQRPDELSEFLSLYWQNGKIPIAKQAKKGLQRAFRKFDAYQLSKWNRDTAIKLRDVLFMVHAKPADDEQAQVWKQLVEGTLPVPDTWETRLSAGQDKREVFTELLTQNKLGYMALLRNLRNMHEAGVDPELVFKALHTGAAKSKALPFRFVAAARAVPQWEVQIDQAMGLALQSMDRLPGETVVLVDVSGSMFHRLSEKSDLSRVDAAAALAALLRGICDSCRVFTFSNATREVPPRHGMALIDAIYASQPHGGTYLGRSLADVATLTADADRLVVVTDEQSQDAVGPPHTQKAYMVNVAAYDRAVGYGLWTRISGWSEQVVNYIAELEHHDVGSPNM